MDASDPKGNLYSLIIVAVVLVFVVRRTLGKQTVHVWMLVVYPIIILLFAGGVIGGMKITTTGIIASIIAAIAGAGLGYARGIHSKVALGPRPGTIVVQGNVLLVVIFVAAFGLRYALRAFVGTDGPMSSALSDAFVAFAAMSVAVARGMLFFTWRRLTASGSASV